MTARSKRTWPLCGALLKSGDPCARIVVREADGSPGLYCANHAKNAQKSLKASEVTGLEHEIPGETEVPAERTSTSAGIEPGVVSTPPPVEAPQIQPEAEAEPAEPMPIASLRTALRGSLLSDQVAESVKELILEGLSASKDVYATCPNCNKRHPVSLPDLNTRISAARGLVEELEGRLQQQVATVDQRVEAIARKTQADLESLTDAELSLLLYDSDKDFDPKSDVLEIARQVLADNPFVPPTNLKEH